MVGVPSHPLYETLKNRFMRFMGNLIGHFAKIAFFEGPKCETNGFQWGIFGLEV